MYLLIEACTEARWRGVAAPKASGGPGTYALVDMQQPLVNHDGDVQTEEWVELPNGGQAWMRLQYVVAHNLQSKPLLRGEAR